MSALHTIKQNFKFTTSQYLIWLHISAGTILNMRHTPKGWLNIIHNKIRDQTEGDLSASVFVTSIIKNLKEKCLTQKRPIILYSDGCGYQNRNKVLSVLSLLHFSAKYNIEIEQKYLEKGHTRDGNLRVANVFYC